MKIAFFLLLDIDYLCPFYTYAVASTNSTYIQRSFYNLLEGNMPSKNNIEVTWLAKFRYSIHKNFWPKFKQKEKLYGHRLTFLQFFKHSLRVTK